MVRHFGAKIQGGGGGHKGPGPGDPPVGASWATHLVLLAPSRRAMRIAGALVGLGGSGLHGCVHTTPHFAGPLAGSELQAGQARDICVRNLIPLALTPALQREKPQGIT